MLIELFVVSAFLVALLSPLNDHFVNMLLFHPETELFVDGVALKLFKDRYGVELTEVDFKSKDGKTLNAWYFKKPDAKYTYLVSHGNGGNLSHRYLLFATLFEANGSVFIYDFQGYGKSEGKPSDKGIVEDGISAYDYLVNDLHINKDEIVGYGESLGCAVTTEIMEARPFRAVILQSPFARLSNTAKDKIVFAKIYPDSLFSQNHLDNVSAYKKVHPPLLVIHGEDDWILKVDYAKEIYNQAIEPKALLILPGCGHNDLYPAKSIEVKNKIIELTESLNKP